MSPPMDELDFKEILGGYNEIGEVSRVIKGAKGEPNISVGDDVNYRIRSIILLISKKHSKAQACEAFYMDKCSDIDKLLKMNPSELLLYYGEKFELGKIFIDNSIRFAFMELKTSFEDLVRYIAEALNLDFEDYKSQWDLMDDDNSSTILSFWSDKKVGIIGKMIEKIDDAELLNKIKNKGWQYPGYCPYDAYNRFSKLVKFPYEDLMKILVKLGHSDKLKGVADKFKFCVDDSLPKFPVPENINFYPVKPSMAFEKKIQILLKRLLSIKKYLVQLEEYYIKYTEIYLNHFN